VEEQQNVKRTTAPALPAPPAAAEPPPIQHVDTGA